MLVVVASAVVSTMATVENLSMVVMKEPKLGRWEGGGLLNACRDLQHELFGPLSNNARAVPHSIP
jgi:hypothetical protein